MEILLRKTDGVVDALDPESGESLTRIVPGVYCDNDNLSTEYEHPEGIFWKSYVEAKRQIDQLGTGIWKIHKIIRD